MRRPFFSLAFALFFIPEIGAATTPEPGCVGKLPLLVSVPLPAPVRPVFGYTRAVEELASTGTIVRPGEKILALDDDNYLFIVVNLTVRPGEETVVYSPRAPAPLDTSPTQGGAAFVATHPSLVRKLSSELKVSEESVNEAVYGSGEFQSASGNLHRVNNASPFFKSDQAHLDYSVSVLDTKMEKTLPGVPKRVLVPKGQVTFEGEKNLAQVAIYNRLSADRVKVREDLAVLIKQLLLKIPSQEIRGGIDMARFADLKASYLASLTLKWRGGNGGGSFSSSLRHVRKDFEPLIRIVSVAQSKGLDSAVEEFCKSLGSNCFAHFNVYFGNFIGAIANYGSRTH